MSEQNEQTGQQRVAELQTELDVLREKRAVCEATLLQSAIEAEKQTMAMEQLDERQRAAESFLFNGNTIVCPEDFLPKGWGFTSFGGGMSTARESTVQESYQGSFIPCYASEADLSSHRALARLVTTSTCPGAGIVETLTSYILGPGFVYSAATKKDAKAPAGLVEAVQDWLLEFLDFNDFCGGQSGGLDAELLRRSACDGEFAVRFTTENTMARLSVLEPAQISDCGSWTELEDRYADRFGTNFTYGVHTPDGSPSTILGYSVVKHDGSWEYLKPHQMQLHKFNVSRNAKRGLSDFYCAWDWLQKQAKVLANVSSGSAEASAISYIIEYAQGVGQTAVHSMKGGGDYTINLPGGRTINKQIPVPGVLNVGRGQEYKPGPIVQSEAFLAVIQGILRQVATRFCLSEGFVSAEDSNHSYASSITAGSRFHRYAVRRQQDMAARYKSIIWEALKRAYNANRFVRWFPENNWWKFMRIVDILAELPPVDEISRPDQHRLYLQLHGAGIMSTQTMRERVGLDHAVEDQRVSTQTPVEFMRGGYPGV